MLPTLRWLVCAVAVFAIPVGVRADTVRVLADVKVHARPDLGSEVLVVFNAGTIVEVNPRQGNWFPVLLPAEARGLRRYGYIAAELVERLEPSRAPLDDKPPTGATSRDAQRTAAAAKTGRSVGRTVVLLADVAVAEHISNRVSRLDLARNRKLGELVVNQAQHELRVRGCRVNEAQLTSIGLYFQTSSVLRILRNAEVNHGGWNYVDTEWDLTPDHEYRLLGGFLDNEITGAINEHGSAPFWVSPRVSADPEQVEQLREIYRTLDSGERLHPRGVRMSRRSGQVIPEATRLTEALAGDQAMVVLIRGRDKPNSAPVLKFMRDAFKDNRYEVGGALVSVFLVNLKSGELVSWDSKIERDTSLQKIPRVVARLMKDLPKNGCEN